MTEFIYEIRPDHSPEFVYDDGGRAAAGFRGDAEDCVVRAVAIATGRPYGDIYNELADRMSALGKPRSARNGIPNKVTRDYLAGIGWEWTPTMAIGSGCRVHLRADELPPGVVIAKLSRHVCTVIDGVVHDTHDPSREGTRCVYGYWRPG